MAAMIDNSPVPTVPLLAPAAPTQGGFAAVERWMWLPLLLIACALPLVLSDYRMFQATMTLIYAIVLFGLTILTGYSGQISLGNGAFFALGGYVSAILIVRLGVPYWATLPVAGAVCMVVGFVFGRPALRLQGHYLALATFALAVATPQFLKHKSLQAWTGGVQGITLEKPHAPFGLPVSPDAWLYWLTLLVAIVLFILGRNLLKGRIGRALLAIRDHPTAAAAMGVNAALYKSLAFGVSAMFTGIAGGLAAIVVQFVAPDSFTPLLSILFLVGAVIGGVSSWWGPLFGAMFIQFVPNFAEDLSKSAPWAIYGVLMIASVFLLKRGIAGAIEDAWRRLRHRKPSPTRK
ncbi:MAG: transporter permease [Ramlibacter sp.]|jgi:branched-chain amino acid transport system permease protein|nr:transporter permease [Ramlibacter sp.]MDB5913333.1 transporter permease [Ramlibacter sp.]